MPGKIIKKFQDEYGAMQGKNIYYATANKQGRDPETFEKAVETKPEKVTKAEKVNKVEKVSKAKQSRRTAS